MQSSEEKDFYQSMADAPENVQREYEELSDSWWMQKELDKERGAA